MIRSLRNRYPLVQIRLLPARVQGAEAPGEIAAAIRYANMHKLADLLIVGRGGGSIEDLWAFNSEALARRIYDAKTPIISAVGHETDFTICDFVADMRAPTPSAAAEIAVPDRRELIMRIDRLDERLCSALVRSVGRYRQLLDSLTERVSTDAVNRQLSARADEVDRLNEKSRLLIRNLLQAKREQLSAMAAKADALSPLSTLLRGYSVAEKDGAVIKQAGDLSCGDRISLIMQDGRVEAEVLEIKGDNK
jgi:exodeoxyribonuclease VII large subunit